MNELYFEPFCVPLHYQQVLCQWKASVSIFLFAFRVASNKQWSNKNIIIWTHVADIQI